MAEAARILIADDHPLMRAALRQAILQHFPATELAEAGTLEAAVAALKGRPPGHEFDLVLLDLTMPDAQGFAGLFLLRAEFPATAVIIVSASDDATTVRRAADYGATGFIPKSALVERIADGVRAVLAGEVWFPTLGPAGAATEDAEVGARLASLTPQQLRVLMLVVEGKLNKQIAFELGIGEATVKAHVTVILRKLGVVTRTQAVIAARALLAGTPSQPTS